MEMKHQIFYVNSHYGEIEFYNNTTYEYKDYGYTIAVKIPNKVRLAFDESKNRQPIIRKISGDVLYNDENQLKYLGKIIFNDVITGGIPRSDATASIYIEIEKARLNDFENRRNHQNFNLSINMSIEVSVGVKFDDTKYYYLTPETHPLQFNYPIGREHWVELLNKIEFHKYNLFEVNFDSLSEDDEVSKKVKSAIQLLNEGGSEKWKASINILREIFEYYEGRGILTKEMPTNLKENQLNFGSNDLSKKERLLNLGWVLKKFCHLASHPKETEWSRDDSILAINGLSMILNSLKKL